MQQLLKLVILLNYLKYNKNYSLFPMWRVQQIQLLGRDMKGPAHDKLWNQLEAEIHLHRHKTVIRACRGRNDLKRPMQAPPGHVCSCFPLSSFLVWLLVLSSFFPSTSIWNLYLRVQLIWSSYLFKRFNCPKEFCSFFWFNVLRVVFLQTASPV